MPDLDQRLSLLETQFSEMQVQLADIQRLLQENAVPQEKASAAKPLFVKGNAIESTIEAKQREVEEAKLKRKAQLEVAISTIQPVHETPKHETSKHEALPPKESEWVIWARQQSMEFWLSRIGIGLFFIGLIFLFRYAVEHGWVTPIIRVVFGFAAGLALVRAGANTWESRRQLSQVLLSGAIAVFYATIYAAYNWYTLIPHLLAMALMTFITMLSLWYAWKLDEPIFSIIATIGGLATPFLLPTGVVNVQGLVAYLNVILVGACLVYWKKSWALLLLVMALGSLLVYGSTLEFVNQLRYSETLALTFGDKMAFQLGILAMAMLVCAIPLYKFLSSENENAENKHAEKQKTHLILLVAISFVLAFFGWFSIGTIWWMSWQNYGYFTVSYALFILGIAHFIYPKSNILAAPFGIVGGILLTAGLVMALPDMPNALLFALTLEALAFIFYDKWRNIKYVRFVGVGMLFMLMGFVALEMILEPYHDTWHTTKPLVHLWLLAIGFATSFWLDVSIERILLRSVALLGWVAWSCTYLPPNVAFSLLMATAWGFYVLYHFDENRTEQWQVFMHTYWGFLTFWMFQDIYNFGGALYAWLDLTALASMAFLSWKWQRKEEAQIYRVVSLLGWAMWCVHFLPLETAFLLLLGTAWALYALFRNAIHPPQAWFNAQLAYFFGIALWIVLDATILQRLHPSLQISGIVSIGAMAWLMRPSEWTRIFFVLQHLLFVVVTFSFFEKIPNGNAFVTTFLGIYTLVWFIVGIWQDEKDLRMASLAIGIFTMGKLFLFDLANLDSLVRILLFLGFGGVCLLLSYYLPKVFKTLGKSE